MTSYESARRRGRENTVSSALEDAFKDANYRAGQCVIQESESTCVFRPGSLADRVDLGRWQMWIYAMRNYPQVPAEPKKKNLLAKPASEKADEIFPCEGAILASCLGYESDKIHSIAQRSPDREIARSALLKARKPDCYKYNEAAFEDYVEHIVNLFSAAQLVTEEEARAAVEIDCSDISPKRSGIPSVYFVFFGKLSRPNPPSPEVISLLDSPISAPLGDDQVREEQERLVREEQERLARQEQERLAREEQERLALEERETLAQEEQERQERLAREE
ncbi:uncharacterized protein BP5553_06826 [Venustampulla echinocandica]|uniref:Uncharacterized protein n=1 Tax=Venustampulla echinocandica TaxID=2656787 RepID=A0A370TL16_9HELO|nr:uncharacterized protein BP5553_06826 [Venustampulla echinocandica]RDL36214.1 hypothetical protein BP5553_06826 [Venustampulla echinocandica]